jgi:chromosome segregation ATPase
MTKNLSKEVCNKQEKQVRTFKKYLNKERKEKLVEINAQKDRIKTLKRILQKHYKKLNKDTEKSQNHSTDEDNQEKINVNDLKIEIDKIKKTSKEAQNIITILIENSDKMKSKLKNIKKELTTTKEELTENNQAINKLETKLKEKRRNN